MDKSWGDFFNQKIDFPIPEQKQESPTEDRINTLAGLTGLDRDSIRRGKKRYDEANARKRARLNFDGLYQLLDVLDDDSLFDRLNNILIEIGQAVIEENPQVFREIKRRFGN